MGGTGLELKKSSCTQPDGRQSRQRWISQQV